MQAPLPPPPAAASPYQPPAAAMTKGSMYTFQKWLMIGMIMLVISATFAQFPLESSVPNVADYDLLDEKESQQYLDDIDSYEGQVALFGAISVILQTGAIVLLGYAFFQGITGRCGPARGCPHHDDAGRCGHGDQHRWPRILAVLMPSASFLLEFASWLLPTNRWDKSSGRGSERGSALVQRR